MAVQIPVSPWVVESRGRVGFGLQVAARPDDPAPGERVLAAGRLAEERGLDAFFLSDHPVSQPEAWTHLSVLAATTERVRLGSVVTCASYRHPTMTARLASDLDHLSGGRLILGLGIGWDRAEFAALGLPLRPVPERQAALEEAVAIIGGAWGEEPFTLHGRSWQAEAVRVRPPLQRPRPPLLIAGAGERTTLRQVAQLADACNFGPSLNTGAVRGADGMRARFAVLRRHCAEVGRPYADILRTHFLSWLMLAESEAAARAKLARYYPAGLTEEQRHTRLATTPDGAVAYFAEFVAAGVQFFVVQSQDAADMETFRLLADEVAPRVRALSPPAAD